MLTDADAPANDDVVEPLDSPVDGEDDPIPIHPIDPVGPPPADLPLDDFDRDKVGLAQFKVELLEPSSIEAVRDGLSADYVNGKPLALPFEERFGPIAFAVVSDSDDGKRFVVHVAGIRGIFPGNLILLLVKVKTGTDSKNHQVGVGIGKLTQLLAAASYQSV